MAAVVVICCVGARSFIVHPSMMGLTHIAMKMKVSCSALMYRKALRLSKPALERTTVGQIVNLLNDVNKFDQGFLLSHIVWIGPIQTAVGTYMLYRTIGVSAFFGVAFFLSIVPLQSRPDLNLLMIRLNFDFSDSRAEDFGAKVEDCAENGPKDKTDERNHFRDSSDKNVHVGEAFRKTDFLLQKVTVTASDVFST